MLEYDVIYEEDGYEERAPEKLVRRVLDTICPEILCEGTFSVSFVCEETIHRENLAYRGIDSATDILTFALDDCQEEFVTCGDEPREWGDILICLDRMEDNARELGVPAREELMRLLIHGVLHLSGMDHQTNDFASEPMLIRQETLLQSMGNMV